MDDKQLSLTPRHMTGTSVIVTPDKEQAVIMCYAHEFTHQVRHEDPSKQQGFQVRVDLIPQVAISLSPEQALALSKSLRASLEDNGLWRD